MTFTIVQNDTAPPIESTLRDEGVPIDLTNATNVRFHMEDKYNRVVVEDDVTGRVSVTNHDLARVEYAFAPGDTTDVGDYTAEWEVVYDDGTSETFPTEDKVEIRINEETA